MVAVLAATIFFSCKNDINTIIKITAQDSIPTISVDSIHVIETKHGELSMELFGRQMLSYQSESDPYTELPKGFVVVIYDSLNNEETRIKANYGISWGNQKLMQAKGNVQINNYKKNIQLNTENLFWDQNKGNIYTDEFVKITEPDKIIMGRGMSADDHLNKWIIHNVTGSFYIDDK
jgi:LPS export ABC transporter protein LptC